MLRKNVYTVGQLNNYIRNMFTQDYLLNSICVQGEVSNLKYHSTGHIYFTLKDQAGTIACIMFAGNRSGLSFRMEEGMEIIVSGNVDVYERDGKYQLYAKKIFLSGNGLLNERFELLKKKLSEMGMFAPEYKRKIPKYIKTLGVVTAPTGAAVRDIIQITKRRNPYVRIILYPAIVQGENAVASIVKGIRLLDRDDVDVIIVGRGGASIEDLWALNEEEVAEAVFNCNTPVISAVGHETDITICDYVADLRAPTPSAAAEIAVFEMESYSNMLLSYKEALKKSMLSITDKRKAVTERYRLKLRNQSPSFKLKENKMHLIRMEEDLSRCMEDKIMSRKNRLNLLISELKGLSPLDKLSQGYCFLENGQGKVIADIEKVNIGDNLVISVKNGEIGAVVNSKKEIGRMQYE